MLRSVLTSSLITKRCFVCLFAISLSASELKRHYGSEDAYPGRLVTTLTD